MGSSENRLFGDRGLRKPGMSAADSLAQWHYGKKAEFFAGSCRGGHVAMNRRAGSWPGSDVDIDHRRQRIGDGAPEGGNAEASSDPTL